MRRRGPLIAGIVALGLLLAPGAGAKTYEVTRTADTAPNGCGNGGCTLREAVLAANARTGADTVRLKPGKTYELEQPGSGEDESATGDLDVLSPLAIGHPGTRRAIIDGGDLDGVVDASAGMDLSGLLVRGGTFFGVRTTASVDVRSTVIAGNDGYGLQTQSPGGPIQLERSRITGNDFQGIQQNAAGALSLVRSSVSGNDNQGIQQNVGGGITLVRSSVSGNEHQGIQQYSEGGVTLIRSTVSGNGHQGVQEYDDGSVVLRRGTVTGSGFQGIQTYDAGGIKINRGKVSGNDSQGIQAYDEGSARVKRAVISGNQGRGLEIYVESGFSVARSTISRNEGGVVIGPDAAGLIKDSTISHNETLGSGGGIYADGTLRLVNSTIANNQAGAGGGIFINGGTGSRLNAVSVVRNIADDDYGGGLYLANDAPLRVDNSLIALNEATCLGCGSPDCINEQDPFTSGGNNLLSTKETCGGFDEPSDLERANPKIGPLKRNGGPTETVALKKGSPAIGKAGNDAPGKDQRGRKRDNQPDIGAFER